MTNYAKFGCTVTKGLELVKKHLDKIPDYDYIVLEFGGNDCDFDWAEVSKAPTAPQRSKTPLHSFIGTYREMIRLIRENGGVPVLLSLPPIDAERISSGLHRGWILTLSCVFWAMKRIFTVARNVQYGGISRCKRRKRPADRHHLGLFRDVPLSILLLCGWHPSQRERPCRYHQANRPICAGIPRKSAGTFPLRPVVGLWLTRSGRGVGIFYLAFFLLHS